MHINLLFLHKNFLFSAELWIQAAHWVKFSLTSVHTFYLFLCIFLKFAVNIMFLMLKGFQRNDRLQFASNSRSQISPDQPSFHWPLNLTENSLFFSLSCGFRVCPTVYCRLLAVVWCVDGCWIVVFRWMSGIEGTLFCTFYTTGILLKLMLRCSLNLRRMSRCKGTLRRSAENNCPVKRLV